MKSTWQSILAVAALLAACGTPAAAAKDDTAQDAAVDGLEDVALSDATTPSDAVDAAADATPQDVQALCLTVTPNPIDFGSVKLGSGGLLHPVIANCGLLGVCLTDLELRLQMANVGDYELVLSGLQAICPGMDLKKGPSPTAPCCLAPNASVTLDLYFTPQQVGTERTAQIWVRWNGAQITVPIDGTATAN